MNTIEVNPEVQNHPVKRKDAQFADALAEVSAAMREFGSSFQRESCVDLAETMKKYADNVEDIVRRSAHLVEIHSPSRSGYNYQGKIHKILKKHVRDLRAAVAAIEPENEAVADTLTDVSDEIRR